LIRVLEHGPTHLECSCFTKRMNAGLLQLRSAHYSFATCKFTPEALAWAIRRKDADKEVRRHREVCLRDVRRSLLRWLLRRAYSGAILYGNICLLVRNRGWGRCSGCSLIASPGAGGHGVSSHRHPVVTVRPISMDVPDRKAFRSSYRLETWSSFV